MNAPTPPLLETSDITKSFGSFIANDAVSLNIAHGEIHALLGENGAGKSTFVKILYGLVRPDRGTIRWQGEPVEITSPARARELGIGMVFQHFALFDALTVAENVALALPPDRSVAAVARELSGITTKYGLALNPNADVGDLSSGERQRIEIVRCLMQSPKLIILDEPTSVLTPQEADQLFETLRKLVCEGRSIIYISHKLEEVKRLCDRATILRHGKVVAECDPRETGTRELARLMVGDVVQTTRPASHAATEGAALAVSGLTLPAATPFGVDLAGISFKVRPGEICAIAGIAGNGQSELFEALSGERTATVASTVEILGTAVGRNGIADRRRLGADFISDERLGHATAPEMRLSENVLVTRAATDKDLLAGGSVIRMDLARRLADRIRATFDVRSATEDAQANALSGGNLQKFVVGRAVDRTPKLLVVNQPTWGVDAGAAARIRQTLITLAEAGTAVLVISQDLDEIYEIADRIAVIADGTLTEFFNAKDLSAEQIGILMSGSEAPHPTAATDSATADHHA